MAFFVMPLSIKSLFNGENLYSSRDIDGYSRIMCVSDCDGAGIFYFLASLI